MNLDSLDKKDRRLLLALDMNARKPDSNIAKTIGLSKQVTNYRIKRLEKNGIIKSYYAVIDHTKLGQRLYRVGIKFENADMEKEKEILDYLMERASWITSVLGPWDIWMAVYADDEYDFMKFWKAFYDKFGFFIANRWISLMTTFWNFERSFIFPPKKNREKIFVLGAEPLKKEVDEVDQKILSHLASNARQTTTELAERLGLSERIVRYRIKRLEKQEVILGYRTFIDTVRFGFKYYKLFILLKNTKSEDLVRIKKHMIQDPHVTYSTEALGGYDLELEVHFRDSQQLFSFITEMKGAFPEHIKDVRHMEYIKEHKVMYYPSLKK